MKDRAAKDHAAKDYAPHIHTTDTEPFRHECWIVCLHLNSITEARLLVDAATAAQATLLKPPAPHELHIIGEAVCARCREELDRDVVRVEHYVISCGACVRARWPLNKERLS